ncbi:MAG: acylphosphatase [Bacteroidales bacterium]|nr:acylphosphatase [Bacteroidales bacterium]MCF8404601.1 acylphosphatase [Bacteroidales bacterium]
MKKQLCLTVKGKVHGVGFRFSCMEAAYKFNISGNVRNMTDGSVYIKAEGEEENLEKFAEWCRKGPVWAKVMRFRQEEGELENFNSFEILR